MKRVLTPLETIALRVMEERESIVEIDHGGRICRWARCGTIYERYVCGNYRWRRYGGRRYELRHCGGRSYGR